MRPKSESEIKRMRIKSILLCITSISSWIISFYSGFQIANAEYGVRIAWYHYADAWGFGLLFLILLMPTIIMFAQAWLDEIDTEGW